MARSDRMGTIMALGDAYRSSAAALRVCLPMAAAYGIFGLVAELSLEVGLLMFVAVLIASIAVGSVLVALYGAPAYAVLLRWGIANYCTAAGFGVLPGVVWSLSIGWLPFGFWLLMFGPIVAIATHRHHQVQQAARA